MALAKFFSILVVLVCYDSNRIHAVRLVAPTLESFAAEGLPARGLAGLAARVEAHEPAGSAVQNRKTLIMADVDDTITCPGHRFYSNVAGADRCPGMKHGEIYYGLGLFLYLLASHQSESARFAIVSANPTSSQYPHIKKYVDTVAEECKKLHEDFYPKLVPWQGTLTLDHVWHGSYKHSARGALWTGSYASMGYVKLKEMMQAAKEQKPDKFIWLGDSGQGDVCAGLCFLYPGECPEFIKKRLHDEGKINFLDEHRDIAMIEKYAFFHETVIHDVHDDREDPVILQCQKVASTKPNMIFFRHDDRHSAYKRAMDQLCFADGTPIPGMPDLVDCNAVKDMWHTSEVKDCIPASKWTNDIYLK